MYKVLAIALLCAILPILIASAETPSAPMIVKIQLSGIRWVFNTTSLIVVAQIGNETKSVDMNVEYNQIVQASAEFSNARIPTEFFVEVVWRGVRVLRVGGIILTNAVKITGVDHDERVIEPIDNANLLVFEVIGKFYSIDILLPIKGDFNVKADVDGSRVDVYIKPSPEGTLLSIENIVFISHISQFSINISSSNSTISCIRGRVSQEGVTSISIDGGIIERARVRTTITSGKSVGSVPTRILKPMSIEGAGAVEKITTIVVTSETIVKGNVPIRFVVYSKNGNYIDNATIEVSIPKLNASKIYRNNETAYIPEGENVTITAKAYGYIPQNKTVIVTRDIKVVEFYLNPVNPSLLDRVRDFAERYLIPIVIGLIVLLVIIILFRR